MSTSLLRRTSDSPSSRGSREALLPEVRDHLLALGLSRPAITDVLLRHAPQDLVSLTVCDEDR